MRFEGFFGMRKGLSLSFKGILTNWGLGIGRDFCGKGGFGWILGAYFENCETILKVFAGLL